MALNGLIPQRTNPEPGRNSGPNSMKFNDFEANLVFKTSSHK